MASPCFGGTYTIATGDATFNGSTGCAGVCDGDDTINIASGTRGTLAISNVIGTVGNPVTIINNGGLVNIVTSNWVGLQFQNCNYIEVSGSGDGGFTYGIKTTNPETIAVYAYNNTDNIEIHHLEITANGIGLSIKTDTAGFNVDINAHDLYVHGIVGGEAVYFGDSSYTSGEATVQGSIHDCIIEDVDYDGIQVGAGINGFEIYNNSIKRVGLVQTGQPANTMTGIMVNEGTLANIHDNWLEDFYKWGVYYQGKTGGSVTDNFVLGGTIGESIRVADPNIETARNMIINSALNSIFYGASFTTGSIHNNQIGNSGGTAVVADGLAVPGEVYDNEIETAVADLTGVVSWTGDYGTSCFYIEGNPFSCTAGTGGTAANGWGGGNIPESVLAADGPSGYTVTITLAGDTWVATLGDDNAITTALIAGITCTSGVQAAGFAANLAPKISHEDIVRVSATEARWDIEGDADYNLTDPETWHVVVPATALTSGVATTASPDITISVEQASTSTSSRAVTYGSGGRAAVYGAGGRGIVSQ